MDLEHSNYGEATKPTRDLIIDCDVHQAHRSPEDVLQFMPPYFRQRGLSVGSGTGLHSPIGVMRADAKPATGGPIGSDPKTTREQLLDAYAIDYAILNGSGILGCGTLPDYDYAAALASAYNEWMMAYWLPEDDRFYGSVIIAPQDPVQAAKEIRRIGNHPRIVQVLMTSATRIPYGQRFYHPIYEAAHDMGLPIAIHPGKEGTGISNPPTGAGYPSSYLEWHTNLSQNYMAQVTSLVCEGVFEKFPNLKFICVEGGIAWLPHLMWRLDKNYKALRSLVPWLKRLPSEYIVDHIRLTTQPIEEPDDPEELLQIFKMIHADKTVMFATDYPHWDFDSPTASLPKMPDRLRRRIFFETASELYHLPIPNENRSSKENIS